MLVPFTDKYYEAKILKVRRPKHTGRLPSAILLLPSLHNLSDLVLLCEHVPHSAYTPPLWARLCRHAVYIPVIAHRPWEVA